MKLIIWLHFVSINKPYWSYFKVNKTLATHQLDVYWRWHSPASEQPCPAQIRRSQPQRGRCSWHALQNLVLPQMYRSGRVAVGWTAGRAHMAHTVSRRCRQRFHHNAGTRCYRWCPSCHPYHWEASTAGREPCHWSVRPGSWELTEALKKRDLERDEPLVAHRLHCVKPIFNVLVQTKHDAQKRGSFLHILWKSMLIGAISDTVNLSREPLMVSKIQVIIWACVCEVN